MIIGLCGRKQHGKTTVASILVEQFGFRAFNFADPLRKMVAALNPWVEQYGRGSYLFKRYNDLLDESGYERAKTLPDVREYLQRMGTEAGRGVLGEDIWVQTMERTLNREIPNGNAHIVIADVRFPNERLFVEAAGGYVFRVTRPAAESSTDAHESERYADEMDVDYTLVNSGTVEDLQSAVAHMMKYYTVERDAL
jgi:hypothetical protein